MASLQGNISVKSLEAGGTEFRLFVMATVGTVHAFHVQAGGEHFLVPSVQLQRADPADATPGAAQAGGGMTHVWLPELLHGAAAGIVPPQLQGKPALVVDVDGAIQRIAVDAIVEAREFLITSAPALMSRLTGVTGVATLADGQLAMVLDLRELSRSPLPVHQQGLRQLEASVQELRHVLVADDSTSVRNTVSALLRDANYRVSTARDGLEAMRAVMDNEFDLVLTDLEMPQLNGFELTEYIRLRSGQRDLPVVMLTSRGQEKHRKRAADAGVSAFLVKPYSDEQLLDTLRQSIHERKAAALAPNESPSLQEFMS